MKNLVYLFLLLILCIPANSETFEGSVFERGTKNSGRIIDKSTGEGIGGAKITLPKQHYRTKTNREGFFELDTAIDGTSIMSVQKDKYKPFSMTVSDKTFNAPVEISIEKSNPANISIDSDMHHLGDNTYSELSANSGEFRGDAVGPFFTKSFNLKGLNFSKPIFLVIGSIIGIDTQRAREMGQNKTPNSYASPPEIFFNGNKIAEIQINGDGQKIRIPQGLLHKTGKNELVIKTGRNLMQTSRIDYDDIEFMNLSIEN